MKVKNCFLHVNRINHEEIPLLTPNFNTAQLLSANEITDTLLCRMPKRCQPEMDRQDFDPMAKTATETVAFVENMEMPEDLDGDNKKKIVQVANSAKKDIGKKAAKKNNNISGQNSCLLHGNNNTHTTDDHNALKAQAEKLEGNTGSNAAQAKIKGKNKTWKNKIQG